MMSFENYFIQFQQIFNLINSIKIDAKEAKKIVQIQNLFQETVKNLYLDLEKIQNEDKKE